MRDAEDPGMKAILLLAFLALGPALAEQSPLVPPGAAPEIAAIWNGAPDAAPIAARTAEERALLCGR
jgi:hypothetical protein